MVIPACASTKYLLNSLFSLCELLSWKHLLNCVAAMWKYCWVRSALQGALFICADFAEFGGYSMENGYFAESAQPLSPEMMKWLRLRRELEERMTDPAMRKLLHEFIEADLTVTQKDLQAAYQQGLAHREDHTPTP